MNGATYTTWCPSLPGAAASLPANLAGDLTAQRSRVIPNMAHDVANTADVEGQSGLSVRRSCHPWFGATALNGLVPCPHRPLCECWRVHDPRQGEGSSAC